MAGAADVGASDARAADVGASAGGRGDAPPEDGHGPTRPLEPIRSLRRMQFLDDEQLDRLQGATLRILEEVGVRFPSEAALEILAGHGARVDAATQVVRFPPDLVRRALADAPRSFTMAARDPRFDLDLEEGVSYFTTDGCGVATIDFDTHVERPSRKSDVAEMARIADYLPSIGFMWPIVSAQDHGATSQLHEIDAAVNNTVKHFQAMVQGGKLARRAIEMATVLAGSREALRERPMLSDLICSIAPLAHDHDGLEAALAFAAAGLPVGMLAMPTLGTTAPATSAGALVVGDAEVISGIVLLQLAHPGTPVFHSIMKAWADPRTGGYVGYSVDSRVRYAPVEMAHHWGLPSLAACFGTDSPAAGTWQAGVEVALDPLLGRPRRARRSSPGWASTGRTPCSIPRRSSSTTTSTSGRATPCWPRTSATRRWPSTSSPTSGRAATSSPRSTPGPTCGRRSGAASPTSWRPTAATATRWRWPASRVAWIRANHHPEPLEAAKAAELARILAAADRELGAGA